MKSFFLSLLATGAFLGLTALAAPALAQNNPCSLGNPHPPNACLNLGAACDNADPDGGSVPGTCQMMTTCASNYCCLCKTGGGTATGGSGGTATGGSSGAMSTGGAASDAGGTSANSSPSSGSSGCSCSLVASDQNGALVGLMFLVGLGAVALDRRRRR